MQKPKIECIYLDMDGVIADFTKRYKELYHMEPREAEKQKQFYHFFEEFIETNQFSTLDLMPGAMAGIEFLRKCSAPTQILSSTSSEARHEAVAKQKLIWLQMHGITFKPNLVPGKRYKKEYAKPDALLIDDTEKLIDQFREAGARVVPGAVVPTTALRRRKSSNVFTPEARDARRGEQRRDRDHADAEDAAGLFRQQFRRPASPGLGVLVADEARDVAGEGEHAGDGGFGNRRAVDAVQAGDGVVAVGGVPTCVILTLAILQ